MLSVAPTLSQEGLNVGLKESMRRQMGGSSRNINLYAKNISEISFLGAIRATVLKDPVLLLEKRILL